MSTLDSKIDDLYRQPLDQFIASRSALASEFKGDDGRRIKALKKPTLVPWAVNQVYWHARPIFDRVQESGADLRRAQIAALEGRKADLQAAAGAHRKAIGSAVEQAITLAKAARMNPDRDAVARTFEALSTAAEPPEPPGRLTHPLQPGGFEMLAGVEPVGRAPEDAGADERETDAAGGGNRAAVSSKRPRGGDPPQAVHAKGSKAAAEARAATERAAAARARERARAAATRRHEAAIARLEREVARAKQQVARARLAWDRATDTLDGVERRLREARSLDRRQS